MDLGRLITELDEWKTLEAPEGFEPFKVAFNPLNEGANPLTDQAPLNLISWRGVYAHLSFEPCDREVTLDECLAECRATNGRTLEGYKGGDFTMTDGTPVWVSGYGESHHWAIIGLRVHKSLPHVIKFDVADIWDYWF